MTTNFVERFCRKSIQKNSKKDKDEVINKLTHLYMNGRKLEEIVGLSCANLRVLYLHSNAIHEIKNLDGLSQLTHLYLQWNRIGRIENLNHLKHLRKLYLSYNEIQRLEGVGDLNQLEELHVEYQNVQADQEFSFDLNSLIGISTSLRVLNVSGLRLTTLCFLKPLRNLMELIAADNNFDCSDDIAASIGELRHLKTALFKGCPAQKQDVYYRNKIILESKSLDNLDNKLVCAVTRIFLRNFDRIKTERRQKLPNASSQANNVVDIDLRDDLQSDTIPFDVANIISQAIDENVQWNAPDAEQ